MMTNTLDRKSWSDVEICTLTDHYAELGQAKMARSGLLPGRSQSAIKNMAEKLGLKSLKAYGGRAPIQDFTKPPCMDDDERTACANFTRAMVAMPAERRMFL